VILSSDCDLAGLTDSKNLSEKKRDMLALAIKEQAVAWCVASASVGEIAQLNILHANMLAMTRKVKGLAIEPQLIRIDG
ncbi:ribonuclease HII, partial [Neisseria arctica]